MNKRTIVYWLDTTGSASFDEIIRLTIIDTNNNILFDHKFSTKTVGNWYSELNGIKPDDVEQEPLFINFKDEVQSLFNQSDKLVTFYANLECLKRNNIKIASTKIEDLAGYFKVMSGDNDTIENLCNYYGYTDLPSSIYERTGIDNTKAVNYCYQQMQRYRQAQES